MRISLNRMVGSNFRYARSIDSKRFLEFRKQIRSATPKRIIQIMQSRGVPISPDWLPRHDSYYDPDNLTASDSLKFIASSEYRLLSQPRSSSPKVNIRIAITAPDFILPDPGPVKEVGIYASFWGVKGRVEVPIDNPFFLKDLTTMRECMLSVGRALMGGAEPYRFDPSHIYPTFWFSSNPRISTRRDPEEYAQHPRCDSSKYRLIFYKVGRRPSMTRELNYVQCWIMSELPYFSSWHTNKDIARFFGISDQTLNKWLAELNQLRQQWGLPAIVLPGSRKIPQ